MTPFSTEKWLSGTRSGCSMCSSPSLGCGQASGPHLPPAPGPGPSSPKGALLSAQLFPWSCTLLKECIVRVKGEGTWGTHYKSELLSDKRAMKSILTSLRCSWTCCLFQPPRECNCGKSGVTRRVTKAWLGSHQMGPFQLSGFFFFLPQVLSFGDVDIL